MEEKRWYVTRNGKRMHGPFSDAKLKRLASSGKLLPSDMLWLEGTTEWVPANSIEGLFEHESVPEELPEFHYAHLPLFRPDHRRIMFKIYSTGILSDFSKTVRTYITGSGGGGTIRTDYRGRVYGQISPVEIKTTHVTILDLWIDEDDGTETSVRIWEDIPLKRGHRVTVVNACLNNGDKCFCLLLNHTVRKVHFLEDSLELIKLSPMERLSILVALGGLIFICILIGQIRTSWAIGTGVIAGILGMIFIHRRGQFLRGRFASHCHDIAQLLL